MPESTPKTRSVVIIGGGISGLSTAWFFHQRGWQVKLLESRTQVGGSILSTEQEGYLFEQGPNSTLQKPGGAEDGLGRLIDQVGLHDALQVANPAAAKRFILRDGRLQPLPTSPPAFLTTSLFSWSGKFRLAAEPFIGRATAEESIAEFVSRRLGREFLDYAIEPFVSGVYAGDPTKLSIRAAIPKIYALERDHGSLIRGAIALGKARKAGMPQGRLISFAGGMGRLPQTIFRQLPTGSIRTGARVMALTPCEAGWAVDWQDVTSGEGGRETGEKVVLALPAPAAVPLISPLSSLAAEQLQAIPYAPIASLALGFLQNKVSHPLDGFGFLIPRQEKVRLLGALFSSTLFPARAPQGHVLITAFLGGALDPESMAWNDSELLRQAHRDLAQSLGITGSEAFSHVTRYSQAIPQYTLGHLERIKTLDELLAPFPGLHTRANWRGGISVADCVRNAEQLVEKLAGIP